MLEIKAGHQIWKYWQLIWNTAKKKKNKLWDISEKNLFYLIWRICLQYFLQDYTLQISICEHKKQIWVSVGRKAFKVCNGPYIKYVGGGRVFVWDMKNFKHILMGHKIFLQIFDGPQNIFLRSPLVILIFKHNSEYKMSKLAIKEI